MSDDFGSFKWLTGDVNYVEHGGKWIRRARVQGNKKARRYHVLELSMLEDDFEKYNVSLSEIDLDVIGPEQLSSALRSCGWELDPRRGVVTEGGIELVVPNGIVLDSVLVEACHGYGAIAPIDNTSGSNWRKLMVAARAVSKELDVEAAHETAMDRPVNQLMTSASNYMQGRIFKGDA